MPVSHLCLQLIPRTLPSAQDRVGSLPHSSADRSQVGAVWKGPIQSQAWTRKCFVNLQGSTSGVLVAMAVNVICSVCRKGPSSLACININHGAISAARVRPAPSWNPGQQGGAWPGQRQDARRGWAPELCKQAGLPESLEGPSASLPFLRPQGSDSSTGDARCGPPARNPGATVLFIPALLFICSPTYVEALQCPHWAVWETQGEPTGPLSSVETGA